MFSAVRFGLCLFRTVSYVVHRESKVLVVVPHSHIQTRSEKLAVMERQSLLEDIQSVLSRKEWQKLLCREWKKESWEREPQSLSHLHTAGQSRCEVGVNIGSWLHKWLDTVRPNRCQILEKCEGGGFCCYLTSQQEPLTEYTYWLLQFPNGFQATILPPFRR